MTFINRRRGTADVKEFFLTTAILPTLTIDFTQQQIRDDPALWQQQCFAVDVGGVSQVYELRSHPHPKIDALNSGISVLYTDTSVSTPRLCLILRMKPP